MIKQIHTHPLQSAASRVRPAGAVPALSLSLSRLGFLLLSALMLPMAASAEDGPTPAQIADWEQRLARADDLQSEGKRLQDAADREFDAGSKACFSRFLVNACQNDAKKKHVAATREARRISNEGGNLERAVRKEQQVDQDARRAADAPRQAAERQAREIETAAERAAAVRSAEEKQAEKSRLAEEGLKRKAADAERQRQKREEHEAKVARKVAEAERRAAADAKKP